MEFAQASVIESRELGGPIRNKKTDDVGLIADAKLNVVLPSKTRAWIQWCSFDKKPTDRVKRGQLFIFANLVQRFDDGAIKFSKPEVLTLILRH